MTTMRWRQCDNTTALWSSYYRVIALSPSHCCTIALSKIIYKTVSDCLACFFSSKESRKCNRLARFISIQEQTKSQMTNNISLNEKYKNISDTTYTNGCHKFDVIYIHVFYYRLNKWMFFVHSIHCCNWSRYHLLVLKFDPRSYFNEHLNNNQVYLLLSIGRLLHNAIINI
jgi:hypothetical protein